MHRVRQSLPYFRACGWQPVVFSVQPDYVETACDDLLLETVPGDIEIHRVKAFSTRWTRKIGLGNLGIRCWWQLRRAVDCYLSKHEVDLIYFSTTVFVSMSLGTHWKSKFGIPFVIDMQDPWFHDYYLQFSKKDRPKKFWFNYYLNKFLEARTVPEVSGLIVVSEAYSETLKQRYPAINAVECLTLPFGAFEEDFVVAKHFNIENCIFAPEKEGIINVIYTGVVPQHMAISLNALFIAVAKGLRENESLFSRLRFSFIGTSYAPAGQSKKTVLPLVKKHGLEHIVKEQVGREPYFSALKLMQDADLLLLPGTADASYTASKLYPYILAKRPVLAIFNRQSSVVEILRNTGAGEIVAFSNEESEDNIADRILASLNELLPRLPFQPDTNWKAFEPYTAREMTRKQCVYFDSIVEKPALAGDES